MLGPDGNPLPPHSSSLSTHRLSQPRPPEPPQPPSQPQRPSVSYRINKRHSRNGSTADPQKIARTLENGKLLGDLSHPQPQPQPLIKSSQSDGTRPRNLSTPLLYPQPPSELQTNGAYRASVSGTSISSANQMLRGVQRPEASLGSTPSFIKQENDENNVNWNEDFNITLQPHNGQTMWQPTVRQNPQGSCCSSRPTSQGHSPVERPMNSRKDSRPKSSHLPASADSPHNPYEWALEHSNLFFGNLDGTVPDKSVMQQLRELRNHPFPADEPSTPDASRCNCGPDCSCLYCVVHPFNEPTLEHMRSLGKILEEDISENQSMSFSGQDAFMNPYDLDGISQNLHSAFPDGVQSPTFPPNSGTPSPVENLPMPYSNAQNSPLTMPLGSFNSSQYLTYEYPFSGLPPCSEPNGACLCDENCTCVGCLTHKNRDRNGTTHQNPPLPLRQIEMEAVTNGHGHEPTSRSCCA